MTKVYVGASVSLDGYIAGPSHSGFDLLFAWCADGEVVIPSANPSISYLSCSPIHRSPKATP